MKLPLALRAVLSTVIIGLAGCAARTADQVQIWQLRGAIKSVRDTTIEVRHKSGQIVRLTSTTLRRISVATALRPCSH